MGNSSTSATANLRRNVLVFTISPPESTSADSLSKTLLGDVRESTRQRAAGVLLNTAHVVRDGIVTFLPVQNAVLKHMSNHNIESLLQQLIEEVRMLRQHFVKPPPPTPEQLERDLTVALGVGRDEVFNK
jgi:hypothetical protein